MAEVKAVGIALRDEKYQRLDMEVDDPAGVIKTLNAAAHTS